MKGFVGDIEEMTEDNSDFRRVLYTAHQMQLVLMALRPGEEIGEETHKDRTQFFRVEKGSGEVWIDGTRSKIKSDTAMIVPAGARHNIRNTGEKPLKLYTIYAPPSMLTARCTSRKPMQRLPKSISTERPASSTGHGRRGKETTDAFESSF